MGEVLPLCASARGLFLCTWTVSYQKCWQSLKTVVSFVKKFRWAWPASLGGPPSGGRPLVMGVEMLWWSLGILPYGCMVAAVLNFVRYPISLIVLIMLVGSYFFHLAVLYSIVYWHQHMPFRLIGAKAKFMIEVIPMITAAALHHLLEFNYGYLALLLCCTTYFYAFAHFLHLAYDIGGIDVLLGIVMQVLAYMLNVELLVRALALSFCFVLCFYRYMTYCAPELPVPRKKELEQLPC
ncbi:uncharacterized protein LOC107774812 [Nicotiana tabacum]|uniref:Uncharacterized protein LOC107774812 n=5 Tax=Nicotiana tabacum TaxID=4097 RepID=A0AC58SK25_TOBAC|nr:uncharacterized protein LOC104108492 [Nicotiana tomentosiformis]XP_009615929.1 uncharacterized protein LOC104108492 [Nicotiana tomentosiformis]XP_009615986.1 uncharacterized protein LOC104108492 [Nicotiana tomentosiformis]XP_018630582.1 uncharacterized protein LOC104108492 [Nicotiana tomentosiformis]XP_018630606.1 uncharacterized protein LOC104108492 [Nicotiana tomentosiformis]